MASPRPGGHPVPVTAPPADRYDFRLAVGGPFHAEYMQIPREWDELPTFASGVYRRVRVPAELRDPCLGDHVLLHETIAAADLGGPLCEAVDRIRSVRTAS